MPENQPNWLAPLVYQKRAWNFYNVCHFNHPMSFCSRVIYYNHSLFWQRVFSFTDHPVSGNDCSNKQVMVLSLCDLCMPVFPSRCSVCVCVCVFCMCLDASLLPRLCDCNHVSLSVSCLLNLWPSTMKRCFSMLYSLQPLTSEPKSKIRKKKKKSFIFSEW